MKSARETFSERSDEYVQARPEYPASLFEWIASQCMARDLAWDCGTGNGQAAVRLAPYFRQVVATDASAEQIAHARPASNVVYSVQPSEKTDLPAGSADLVVAAQALHWFEARAFWEEVRRVARPGAFFCAWGYHWFNTAPAIQHELVMPFREIIYPFWALENRILWNGYRTGDVALAFPRVEVPSFAIAVEWSAAQLLAYLMTWSAYKRSRQDANAARAMDALLESTRELVAAHDRLAVTMPLTAVAARIRPT
jgi:SAM-dependent methyltransferase